jgi:hypothetical protein
MKIKALSCLLGMLIATSAANAEITYKAYKASKAAGGGAMESDEDIFHWRRERLFLRKYNA